MKKVLVIGLLICLLTGMTGCDKEEVVRIEDYDWNLTFVLSGEDAAGMAVTSITKGDDGSKTPTLIVSMDGYDINFQSENIE